MHSAYRNTQTEASEAPTLFGEMLAATFGALNWLPIPDGQIHRFHVPGDRSGSQNGWYVLFAGRIALGCFGSWKAGSSQMWSSREPTSPLETEHPRQRIKQARRQREVEQHRRQQAAAECAARLWRDARRANPEHPYLTAKGCRAHNLRQSGNVLLVPLYQAGVMVNLQRIGPDGGKRFLSGGMVKGCYAPFGIITAGKPLYLCEGWVTGATIHESTGHPVACAMNAGNLLPAGQQLRRAYPASPLIFAGDDDRKTEGNPGRTHANRAAAMLGCDVVFPPWSGAEPLALSDFNDLRQWREANP